jgi:N-methylhydantoinase A/oxoprolinase/acetone carboxylase beta subunit
MTIIAVDIGGTFTDVCCLFKKDGRRRIAWTKEPSSRDDPVLGVVRGVARMLREVGRAPASVVRLLHGTTVGTNAVLERRGARIGLLMTDGFEDTLELGRGSRSDMYRLDPAPETPGFLAPGRRRRAVGERIACDGEILVPLDEVALRQAVTDLVEHERVQAIGVCYLFSYVNPVHERRTAEIVAETFPDLPVSLSHEVDPVFREYERTCMTAFDAYLRPVMAGYLGRLSQTLREAGLCCDVFTMQSRGSRASTRVASARPVSTMLSGPAALRPCQRPGRGGVRQPAYDPQPHDRPHHGTPRLCAAAHRRAATAAPLLLPRARRHGRNSHPRPRCDDAGTCGARTCRDPSA